jgi:hypothetical protein
MDTLMRTEADKLREEVERLEGAIDDKDAEISSLEEDVEEATAERTREDIVELAKIRWRLWQ